MKISQEVVGTGSPPLSGHMFNREAAGQKRPDELEDVTERLTAIESAREVVTRRNLQTFVFFRIHLEETEVFLI